MIVKSSLQDPSPDPLSPHLAKVQSLNKKRLAGRVPEEPLCAEKEAAHEGHNREPYFGGASPRGGYSPRL